MYHIHKQYLTNDANLFHLTVDYHRICTGKKYVLDIECKTNQINMILKILTKNRISVLSYREVIAGELYN